VPCQLAVLTISWNMPRRSLIDSRRQTYSTQLFTYGLSSRKSANQSLRSSWHRMNGPVWVRERCRISPPRFLAECCKRQLNQGSFVLLYFRLFTFSHLYWVCLSVFYAFSALTLLVGWQEGHLVWLSVWSEVQLMPLPLTVSCFSKIQIGVAFLVPAHPRSPWQS